MNEFIAYILTNYQRGAVESVCDVLKPLVDAWLKRVNKKEVQRVCASLRKQEVCNAIDVLLGSGSADYLKSRLLNTDTGTRSRRCNIILRDRIGVIFGLTEVIPKFYRGWDGYCPGCDKDASMAEMFCKLSGIPYEIRRDKRAIRDAFKKCVRKTFGEDNVSLIYISSHGGQERDRNGDEEDGLDETICLADGQFSDDLIYNLMCEAPDTQTFIFITDCCNSGTNYKGFHANLRSVKKRTNFKGTVLHIGGCHDGESSIGLDNGGALTLGMAKCFKWDTKFIDFVHKVQCTVREQKVSYMSEGPKAKAIEQMTLAQIAGKA